MPALRNMFNGKKIVNKVADGIISVGKLVNNCEDDYYLFQFNAKRYDRKNYKVTSDNTLYKLFLIELYLQDKGDDWIINKNENTGQPNQFEYHKYVQMFYIQDVINSLVDNIPTGRDKSCVETLISMLTEYNKYKIVDEDVKILSSDNKDVISFKKTKTNNGLSDEKIDDIKVDYEGMPVTFTGISKVSGGFMESFSKSLTALLEIYKIELTVKTMLKKYTIDIDYDAFKKFLESGNDAKTMDGETTGKDTKDIRKMLIKASEIFDKFHMYLFLQKIKKQ